MVKIIYVEHDGTEHSVDVEVGTSIMEGAVSNSIPGIDADCGGGCACATCMVFIGDEWKAGNLSYHLKSRPTWEGFMNDEILNDAKEYLCVDDVCVGTYK